MDAIPTEIFLEILSYLSKEELGSVRLVSHFFESVANALYFRTIRVRVTEAGLEKLQEICRRPKLANVWGRLMIPISGVDESGTPRLYAKQKALEDSGVFANTLRLALLMMQNVREIITNWNGDNFEYCRERPEKTIVGMGGFEEMEPVLGAFKELMAAASHANTRLEKLSTHSV
ncbi:hypothetical protein RUND412_009408 [Rhizina undulata]